MCSAWSCGLRSGGCIGSSVGRSARSTSALVCAAGPFAGRWASEKPLRSRRAPSPSKLDPFRDWVCRQLQAARIARAPLCGYTGPEFQRTLLARAGHAPATTVPVLSSLGTRKRSVPPGPAFHARRASRHRRPTACFARGRQCGGPAIRRLGAAWRARTSGLRSRACALASIQAPGAPSRDHARLPVCRRGWRRDRRFCFDWPAGPEQTRRSPVASC